MVMDSRGLPKGFDLKDLHGVRKHVLFIKETHNKAV